MPVRSPTTRTPRSCATLRTRGLRPPLLVASDGGPGLIGALDRVLPTSARQRCLVHRSWNVLAKVSKADAAEVKADFWAIFDDVDAEPGEAAVAQARRHAAEFAGKWGGRYPGAVAYPARGSSRPRSARRGSRCRRSPRARR